MPPKDKKLENIKQECEKESRLRKNKKKVEKYKHEKEERKMVQENENPCSELFPTKDKESHDKGSPKKTPLIVRKRKPIDFTIKDLEAAVSDENDSDFESYLDKGDLI